MGKVDQAIRPPRLSAGSEGSLEKGRAPALDLTQMSEPISPPSTTPSEFDFDTMARDQRTPPTMTPWTSSVHTTTQPVIGCAPAQMIGGASLMMPNNIRPASNVDELSGVE